MRKIIASVTFLVCLTSSASAMDMRGNGWNHFLEQNSLKQKIGWDQKNLDIQTRSAGSLIARIKKLETENEQLRNSISLIRDGKTSYGKPAPDPRIQGLIDENKRLSAQLEKSRISQSSTGFYVQQINTLKTENQKLSRKIEELSVSADASIGVGGGIMDDTSVLKAYMEENNLLKEALNQRGNGAERIVMLQQQIEDLKAENQEFKLKDVSANSGDVLGSGAELARKEAEIASLKKDLVEAQEKNRELNSRLDLASISAAAGSSDKDIEALRQQNESLRETIKAQSETLRAADNAAKTAERLLTENATLQNKLDRAKISSSTDSRTVQEMVMRIKTLEEDVAQRDLYIKKMLAAKSQELAELSNSSTPNAAGHVASLREKNSALAFALDKEKESNIAYRRKISEYQKEIERIRELEQASSSGVHRASIFERHVKNLEQKNKQAENTVTSLKLENQELKARLELMADNAGDLDNIQPALGGNPASSAPLSEDKEANFFDEQYPPTERILPVLDENEDGARALIDDGINEALEDRLAVNNEYADPEKLLATELTPLAESISR